MSSGWVEAPPVVADLENDLVLPSPTRTCAVLAPACFWTFASASRPMANSWVSTNSESASRGPGPRTSMLSPSELPRPVACLASAATSPSWTGSRCSSKMSERISLCTLLVRSALVARDRLTRPEGSAPSCSQSLLRGACMQYRREQGLRYRIVEISSYPPPFLHRPCALRSAGFGELPGGSFPLAHQGAQEQRRQRRDPDVQLRAERAVVDRLLGKGPEVVGRYTDRHARGDRNGQRRAGKAESERHEDQRRKHRVPDGFLR